MWRQPAQLVLVMWSCLHCSLTAEFCIGAGAHHRAPQLGALSQAPPHTPSLPPRLAWHCPTPPTPACSRTIFQMDVSILLLVIKTRGQRCLAQLCTEGAGHSLNSPPRASLPRAAASPMHPVSRRQAVGHTHPSQAGSSCTVPTQVTVPPGLFPRGAQPHSCPSLSSPRPDASCRLASGPCGGRHRTGPGVGR